MAEFNQSDESLLHLIAERDTAALEAIYDRHAQIVFNIVSRIVQDSALADEILHDTFWLVWQNAHTYRSSGPPAAGKTSARNKRAAAREVRATSSARAG